MDIITGAIGNIVGFVGNNLVGIVLGAIGLGLSKAYVEIIKRVKPEKYVKQVITILDDVIDRMKVKHPEAGKELEKRLRQALVDGIKIVDEV